MKGKKNLKIQFVTAKYPEKENAPAIARAL
jgi:hypothetical protein